MRRGGGPPFLALLLLLAQLSLLGHGNEGSSAGSCYCDKTFGSKAPPTDTMIKHLQKQLKCYDSCTFFIRFHLPSKRTVCGGSREPWVTELIRCFDSRECGHASSRRVVHQHSPLTSTQVPEATERAPSDMGTLAQTYLLPTLLPTTQQTILPTEAPSLDKKLTHANETTTSSAGQSLEAGENQKQLEENVGPTAATLSMVPVLSLLGIIFILTTVLLYVLCKRRKEHSLQYSPGLQLHYTPMAPDYNA